MGSTDGIEMPPDPPVSLYSKEDIDRVVAERDIERLCGFIMLANMATTEVRAHLASTIRDLLTKRVKFANHRPKRDDRKGIAQMMWLFRTQRPDMQQKAHVADLAKMYGVSESTVWSCWKEYGAEVEGEMATRGL